MKASGTEGRTDNVAYVAPNSQSPSLKRMPRLANWAIRRVFAPAVRASDWRFTKRPWGTSRGRLVWREPLVWAAADIFELVPGASLPPALYREHAVSREAALEAVRNSERGWHIVFTSPSLTGVRAAALAGLAVTPLPAVGRGLRILGERTACRRFWIWISRFSRGPDPGPPSPHSRRRRHC